MEQAQHEANLGLLLLSPWRDASSSQGYPQQLNVAGTHLYTWVKRDKVE